MTEIARDTKKGLLVLPRQEVVAGTTSATNIAVEGIKKGDDIHSILGFKTDQAAANDVKVLTREASVTSDGNIQLDTTDTTGYQLVVTWSKPAARDDFLVSIATTPASGTLDISDEDTQVLTTVATFENGRTLDVSGRDKGCTYESDTPAVATVSASGLVTPVSAGTATITVTYQDKTDTYVATVQA